MQLRFKRSRPDPGQWDELQLRPIVGSHHWAHLRVDRFTWRPCVRADALGLRVGPSVVVIPWPGSDAELLQFRLLLHRLGVRWCVLLVHKRNDSCLKCSMLGRNLPKHELESNHKLHR